jgi:uncharacterized membrane protein YeaQ/YmgE (transglycosylase-associated protein family)
MWGDSGTFKGCGLAKALLGMPFAADLKVGESIARASASISFGDTSIVFDHIHSGRRRDMNFILWLVVGGLIGWVASMIMKTDAQQGVLLNVVVGIVGALLGGWLLAPLFGTGTINSNDFSIAGLGVSLLGAIILLAIVNLVRRKSVR